MTTKKGAKPTKNAVAPEKQFTVSSQTPFPTNVLIFEWTDPKVHAWNEQFAKRLYHMRSDDPNGIYRSNQAGTWHSKDTVLKDTGAYGEQLNKMFTIAFSHMMELFAIEKGGKYWFDNYAWAMMYKNGGLAAPHNHPNCHVSGVYYVDDGEPAEAQMMATGTQVAPGALEFLDSRSGVGQQQLQGFNLQPSFRLPAKKHRMVVFPSGLKHMVYPFSGSGERISVACNGTIKKYEPLKEG